MSAPINSVQPQQPIGAYTLNGTNVYKVGQFVVNPPEIIPYSFYEDLKKGDGFFKDALKIVTSKDFENTKYTTKKKTSTIKKLLGIAATIATGILIYKKRNSIISFFKNLKK